MRFEGSLLDIQMKYIIKEVKKALTNTNKCFILLKTEHLFLVKKEKRHGKE